MNIAAVFEFAEKYNMLPEGVSVLCAVSGGADSVCLLHVLSRQPELRVVCAHYNHRIRGAESDRDEAFVRTLSEKLGVEFVCGRGDVPAYAGAHGLGLEEAAREMRYAFLEAAAQEHGCSRIATAHNAGDNAETVLMNLARGTGLRGLCGIPPVRGMIIRPLLGVTRDEIEEYLRENGLDHVEDSTNRSDDYTRNRLRHHALPLLEEINSGALKNIARASESLRQDEAFFEGEARAFLKRSLKSGALPVRGLRELPRPVRMRVFRELCGQALSEKHALALERLCLSDEKHGYADIPGLRVERERESLIFGAAEMPPLPDTELIIGGETAVPGTGLRVRCELTDGSEEIHNSFNTFYFKNESICGRIFLTSRKEGDKIRLCGRSCTKSLKKLFTERKIPLAQRERVPVLRDEKGVLAVCGFGVDERCCFSRGGTVLKIELNGEDGTKSYE